MNNNYGLSYTDQQWRLPPKRWLVLATILLVFVIAFLWIKGHGFVNIQMVSPQGSGTYTYTFTNQNSGKATTVQASASSLKKLLSKGNYEITVRHDGTNYFAVKSSPGFLQTKAVSGSMEQERVRQFIGNGPAGCMVYNGNLLLSYDCGGIFSTANLHTAATPSQPTYTQPLSGFSGAGSIEGWATLEGHNLMLVKTVDPEEGTAVSHTLYTVTNSFGVSSQTQLKGADPDTTYSLQTYKKGFLLYDSAFSQLLYYTSASAQPQKLSVVRPVVQKVSPVSLIAYHNAFAILYNNSSGSEDTSTSGVSEVVVYGAGAAHYQFKQLYSSAYLCGNRLCLLGNHALDAYDLSNKKPQKAYSVRGVNGVVSGESGFFVDTSSGVIKLNTALDSGYYAYSLGSYSSCGIQDTSGGFLLCVTAPSGTKSVLYINSAAGDSVGIDKKVLALEKRPEVASISVYGNYIFVVPDVGNIEYDQATNTFGYNAAKRAEAKRSIARDAAALGITNPYQVIDTLP